MKMTTMMMHHHRHHHHHHKRHRQRHCHTNPDHQDHRDDHDDHYEDDNFGEDVDMFIIMSMIFIHTKMMVMDMR